MKINFLYFITLSYISIILFLNGCTDNPVQNDISEDVLPNNDNIYVSKLLEMGFDASVIDEYDEYLIVEGDIRFPKSAPIFYSNPLAKTKHRYCVSPGFYSTISPENTYITVYIHPSINGEWKSAMKDAMDVWEDVANCIINYQEVYSSSADIIVISDVDPDSPMDPLPSNKCGWGDYAGTTTLGKPGKYIILNQDSNCNSNYLERRYVCIHEIGHTLSLLHTDTDQISYPLIPGSPDLDPESVMNTSGYNSTMTLSDADKQAITILYPNTNCMIGYYNSSNGDYFYTQYIGELGSIYEPFEAYGYEFKDIAAFLLPTSQSGTVPLHRFFHYSYGKHFYTIDYNEGINAGFTYEGVIGYVYTWQKSGTKKLDRWYNSNTGAHKYTTKFFINPPPYWHYEGPQGYVFPAYLGDF